MPRYSVLDLAPITEGSDASTALAHARELAQHVERLGYDRYWLAEHHNMPGIASAATAVALAHVGAATSTIRIGAGGIMLPNHAPLVIAEQFGTLEALFPGRIDLGLGRAPGTDFATARALRRTLASNPDAFPQDISELMSYFEPREGQGVRAVPGAGLEIPLYILGSSLFGASVAAALGLPFAFASHFAPAQMTQAIQIYRTQFRPSDRLAKPHLILGINVLVAPTDEEASFLSSSGRQASASLRSGRPIPLPPPSREFEKEIVPFGRIPITEVTSVAMIGSPDTVREGLHNFTGQTEPDELIVVTQVYDHALRLRSFELLADIAGLEPRAG